MMTDLNALAIFAVVAEERNFRAAADRLGVTRSAVSQTIRKLESQLGSALLVRTTRSVGLTDAGKALLSDITPALADIRAATERTGHRRDEPRGQLKLAVSSIAESFLSGPMLASFSQAYPDLQIDVTVTDEEFDIVAEGFDAGVRLGELIEQDMIAVPVSQDQRQIVVAAPSYLEKAGRPSHPSELARHRCIGWRPHPNVAPYRWEFTENDRDFRVSVAPEITTNDMALMTKIAISGGGIICGMEESFTAPMESGDLVIVLEEFCPKFPGFYLFFPSRHSMTPKLRALLDHIRHHRISEKKTAG